MPKDAVFACEGANATCPDGRTCRFGYCFPDGPDAGPSFDACTPISCGMAGATCGAISDGCGAIVQCGSCVAPETCGGGTTGAKPNTCGCTPLTAAVACQIAGKNCGSIMVMNGCGVMTPFSCGPACPDGGGCLQETDGELCASAGYICGTLGVTDRCEIKRLISCGSCGGGSSCQIGEPDDGGSVAQCGPCIAEDDATICNANGYNCGTATVTDVCTKLPRMVTCGDCLVALDDGGTPACGVAPQMMNQCACQGFRAGCQINAQCCTGTTCGPAGLCCAPIGSVCSDDADCCGTGICEGRPPDGGSFCAFPD